MSKKLRELQARKSEHLKAAATAIANAQGVLDIAAAANRDLTDDEKTVFDKHQISVKTIKGQIDHVQAQIDLEQDRIATEAQIGSPEPGRISGGHDRREDDPKHGFSSLGEYARAVYQDSLSGGRPDERLLIGAAAPTSYGGEGAGQDGGFLVPPEFSSTIFTLSLGEDSMLPMTDNNELTGNSMVYPKDETTPWGTDGVRAYWQSEASVANAGKPKLGTSTLRLHKLMALVPITDELLADSNALAGYLPGKAGDSIRWKTNEAFLNGTGAGQPVGALNSGATITVAKDGGQAANTLSMTNITNMISRLPAGSLTRAVWFANPDLVSLLPTLTIGNYPVFLPLNSGAQAGSTFGMLMGRPVILTEHAAALSGLGDLSLFDFKYYRSITKAGGIQMATSMHLYFDADATAFRFTFRVDGQSKIANPITPPKSTKTRSPFIQLAAR